MSTVEIELAAWLESLGARIRRRRDGSLHTVDFASVPHAVTAEVLERLAPAARLKVLLLRQVPLDDAAAATLAGFLELEELDARGSGLTDVGLERLKGLRQLKILQLTGAPISRAALKSLRQALLNCRIVYLD